MTDNATLCPVCGKELISLCKTSIPPIYESYCPNCQYSRRESSNEVGIVNLKTGMPDREKVMLGLKACNRQSYNGSDCQNCPYYDDEDTAELPLGICNIQDMFDDALALLREQEARELSESCDNCDEYDKEKHSFPKFCRVIRETVDEMKSKWIPVTERLPEKSGFYLCYTEFKIFAVLHFSRKHKLFNWFDGMNPGEINSDIKCIAWMPIPKPPKEED